jgi:hypothetical protein
MIAQDLAIVMIAGGMTRYAGDEGRNDYLWTGRASVLQSSAARERCTLQYFAGEGI